MALQSFLVDLFADQEVAASNVHVIEDSCKTSLSPPANTGTLHQHYMRQQIRWSSSRSMSEAAGNNSSLLTSPKRSPSPTLFARPCGRGRTWNEDVSMISHASKPVSKAISTMATTDGKRASSQISAPKQPQRFTSPYRIRRKLKIHPCHNMRLDNI